MSAEQDRANRSSTHAASPAEGRQRSGFVVLPVAIFFGLAIMFAFALFSGDPSKLPSALIGRPAPQVDFAPLEGLKHAEQQVPGFTAKELADGNVHVVNFWASWCIPCVQEHPYLVELQKRTGVAIMGVNYKDGADDGRRFIGRYGNPFKAVGVDPLGRGAIEWGVYGMPETFIVDGSGRIAFKQVGPITNEAALEKMIAEIDKARAKTAAKPQS